METSLILKREHLLIKTMLVKTGALFAAPGTPQTELQSCLRFFGEYADTYHHAKEEKIYFPWLVRMQPDLEEGPVAVMLYEHDVGRKLMRSAQSSLDRGDRLEAARYFAEFRNLLREHIFKEDNILYAMADRVAQENNGDSEMLPQFEAVARELREVAERWNSMPILAEVSEEAAREGVNPRMGCGGS
ncbi:MAG: hemerythrin domain-containing protein [Bdellovibrionota bacterium]